LLAAMLDNHLQQGNLLSIDPRRVVFRRVVDMNDRALRNVVVGLGGRVDGIPRQDGYDITVASEVMAILCLATSISDLKERLGKIIVGYTYENQPVTAGQLKANGAMAVLLKDAIKPNLVQTLEGVPAFIHGGPFANIAHGCNSVMATKLALHTSDYAVTEAGFGADLGAEKFLDIKCRAAGLWPDVVVLVATVRALKMHGGVSKGELTQPNVEALKKGSSNLKKHIENMQKFDLPVVVAVNIFPTDTAEEMNALTELCTGWGVPCELSDVWAQGGEGGLKLADRVIDLAQREKKGSFLYSSELTPAEKICKIAQEIYGATEVQFEKAAQNSLKQIKELGFNHFPICMAKTQYSFSDDPTQVGRPEGFTLTIRDIRISAGAGFLIALTGEIMTMPGLPKVPAAESIDIDDNGKIIGLF
jgi:formate--tetrahydrofolate ligase